MANILEDDNLDQMVCNNCHKYLSMFPIKVYENREIKCGRCCTEDDGGQTSLFELLAKECLFKCVNRYEGCRKLLRPEDTKLHEEHCKSTKFSCPKCDDGKNVDLSPLGLIWHYKLKHALNFIKKNSFTCNQLLHNDFLLYIQNDVIFFINYQYLPSIKTLYIAGLTLTDVNVKQQFVVTTNKGFKYSTIVKECKKLTESSKDYFEISLNEPFDSIEIFFDLEVSLQSKEAYKMIDNNDNCYENFPVRDDNIVEKCEESQTSSEFVIITKNSKIIIQNGYRIDPACTNCDELMGLDIYMCDNKHYYCRDCKDYCVFCKKRYRNPPISIEMPKTLKFPCKYCTLTFTDIKDHEYMCESNIKKCPVCLEHIQVNQLENHFNKFHESSFSKKFNFRDLENYKNTHYFLMNQMIIRAELFSYFTYNDKDYLGFRIFFKIIDNIKPVQLLMFNCYNVIKIVNEFAVVNICNYDCDVKHNNMLYVVFP